MSGTITPTSNFKLLEDKKLFKLQVQESDIK